jgi:hypothetical protein
VLQSVRSLLNISKYDLISSNALFIFLLPSTFLSQFFSFFPFFFSFFPLFLLPSLLISFHSPFLSPFIPPPLSLSHFFLSLSFSFFSFSPSPFLYLSIYLSFCSREKIRNLLRRKLLLGSRFSVRLFRQVIFSLLLPAFELTDLSDRVDQMYSMM